MIQSNSVQQHDTTDLNVDAVRAQIAQKLNYNVPYYATNIVTGSVLTDMDQFPYHRFFRGVYHDSQPIVIDREAGWRPIQSQCYKQINTPRICKPNYCWEYACSTVFPCAGQDANIKSQNKAQNCGKPACNHFPSQP